MPFFARKAISLLLFARDFGDNESSVGVRGPNAGPLLLGGAYAAGRILRPAVCSASPPRGCVRPAQASPTT